MLLRLVISALPGTLSRSDELAGHRSEPAVISMERVASDDFDRACKRSRQHHFAGVEKLALGGQPVGEPGHAVGGMVEDAGGDAGLLDLAVAKQQRANPAQVEIERPNGPAADDERRIGGVVEIVSITLRGTL